MKACVLENAAPVEDRPLIVREVETPTPGIGTDLSGR